MPTDDHRDHLSHRHPDQANLVLNTDDPDSGSGQLDSDAVPETIILPVTATPPPPSPAAPSFYKGISYGDAVYGSYLAGNSLPAVAALGANAVAVGSSFGIDAVDSSVYSDAVPGGVTESDSDVGVAIGEAQAVGLSVMVKPTIDFLPSDGGSTAANQENGPYAAGESRTIYNPTDISAFFASYQAMILKEATLAQSSGATIFCIGTELDQLTGPAYLSYWTSIISAVRAVYDGKLTYAANWDDDVSPWQGAGSGLPAGTGNLATQVSFWSQLDGVGINEYAPISDLADPTLDQLISGWTEIPTDAKTLAVTGQQSLMSYYEGVAASVGKPLLFTEMGYGNASDAAISPGHPGLGQDGLPDGAVADPTLQANLYEAFFDAWQQYGDGSLVGAFLWDWQPASNSADPFDLQGQPAAEVVANAYTACYAEGTRIATQTGEVCVETLRAGDLVLTAAGKLRAVTWMGHRSVRFGETPGEGQPYPIRICEDAFAPGVPRRDLVLSPDHAVFVDGVLIAIRRLVNGASVLRHVVPAITYWHLELSTHDILLAEGLAAESYLDTGNRASFANARATTSHCDFERDFSRDWTARCCAELVEDGPVVDTVRRHLAARARALGWVVPDMLDVEVSDAGLTSIVLPEGIELVRLKSETFRVAGDCRQLGILLSGLSVDGAAIALDEVVCTAGFHRAETHGSARVRWTDGDAILALGTSGYPRILGIDVAMVKPVIRHSA